MSRIDLVAESPISGSSRTKQLEAMFDVPHEDVARVEWHGDVDLDAADWQIGLIVGPSGSGKSLMLRELFDGEPKLRWGKGSVIDDFAKTLTMDEISGVCQSVGFNTIPAWLRPHAVLSNGEQFRVDLARRLLETPAGDTIVVDEFTSVVDRQVAKIGAHAVAKWVRRNGRRFVAASCHYDVEDWLQPDWVLEPATMTLTWRSVQPRPRVPVVISPAPYAAWRLFSRFHYLTADLSHSARCFVLYAGDDLQPAGFAGVLYRPHPRTKNVYGISRQVTLPDWQGMGVAFVLADYLGALYKSVGRRLHHYPAHPSFIRALDHSPRWALVKKPMQFNPTAKSSTVTYAMQGQRPNATFAWCGGTTANGVEITREQAEAVFASFDRKAA